MSPVCLLSIVALLLLWNHLHCVGAHGDRHGTLFPHGHRLEEWSTRMGGTVSTNRGIECRLIDLRDSVYPHSQNSTGLPTVR